MKTGQANEKQLGTNRAFLRQAPCKSLCWHGPFSIATGMTHHLGQAAGNGSEYWHISAGLLEWDPKYTILLLLSTLSTFINGTFLTLNKSKAKSGSENPKTSSKLLHPGKYFLPWEMGLWANNPGFVVALPLACKACGMLCQLWNKSWGVSEILTQAKVSLTSVAT